MKVVITSLLLLMCAPVLMAQLYFPPQTGAWETEATETYNWCDDQLDSLQQFLAYKNTKGFIILKSGKIVVEWYFDDFTQDSVWYWASVGKSLMATLVGIAEQEGDLVIDDPTSDYLGTAWTNCTTTEADITIWHQLTMTTGLNELTSFDCTLPSCLTCKAAPSTRWAYHNGPYSLLRDVVESATSQNINTYYRNKIGNVIGANGAYFQSGFNQLFFSTPRAMARFGLLMLAEGNWDGEMVLNQSYYSDMTSRSQSINPSYGYLWWLNGQGQYKQPGLQFDFTTDLIPSAPDDLFAGMGKNEQRIYIVPSEEMVVVRVGEEANDSAALAVSGFDTELWTQIMNLECAVTSLPSDENEHHIQLFPNPSSQQITIKSEYPIERIRFTNLMGQSLLTSTQLNIDISNLPIGYYLIEVTTLRGGVEVLPFLKE